VAEESHEGPDGPAVAAEIDAEDGRVTAGDGDQPGQRPQERGLSGPVGTAEQHDLAGLDVEVDTGEGGEAAEQADRTAKSNGGRVDGGVHGDRRDGIGRRLARGIGKTLIGLGVLLLLFVAYQLWGTGLQEARAQDDLVRQFRAATATTVPASTPPETVPGGAVALLRIPKIGVDKVVVEGVGVPDLKKGPGHYPGTPLPGQPGNAAIAGHRTTYGQPFYRLDELGPGDEIRVTTGQGRFRYEVTGSKVVSPSDVSVLTPTTDARLTLTTCNPRYSARQRLIVSARLVDEPAPPPPSTGPAESRGVEVAGLSGDRSAAGPTVMWGALAAAVALATWLLSRRWRPWPAYLLGAIPFLVVLFVFYENVARLLPANI
jgi:sortase A